MRRALYLFALLLLLLGGTHLLEPAEARAEIAGPLHCVTSSHMADCHAEPAGETDDLTHVGHHHHCPLAVNDMAGGVALVSRDMGDPFAANVAALASLGRAPPLEPPSA